MAGVWVTFCISVSSESIKKGIGFSQIYNGDHISLKWHWNILCWRMRHIIYIEMMSLNISKAAVMVEIYFIVITLLISAVEANKTKSDVKRKRFDVFSCFRGAQSERPVPVSSGAVHTANHGVPRLCSEHRRCSRQCSPQCTAVPQNHGWREVMSPASAQAPSRHLTMSWWISTLDEGSTFVMNSNNVNYLKFFEVNPWSCFLVTSISYCCQWRFYCPKTHALDILHICHKLFFFFSPVFSVLVCLAFIRSTVFSRKLKF